MNDGPTMFLIVTDSFVIRTNQKYKKVKITTNWITWNIQGIGIKQWKVLEKMFKMKVIIVIVKLTNRKRNSSEMVIQEELQNQFSYTTDV